MHPILFKIGKLSIYTYGFFVAAGFLAGIWLARKEAKRLGQDPEKIMDLCFYILIAAIAGSRLFYVAVNYRMFLQDPLEIFRLWNGGLIFYGGFIAALLVSLTYLRRYHLSVWKTADILAPSLALGHSIGRIGCFCAGCCYGKACDLPWAVTFTHPETLAPMNIPLHPTQLYASITNLAIFAVLWKVRRRRVFEGWLFWLYVLMYALARSVIELFRGDFRGTMLFGVLSISQCIGIIMAAVAIVMMMVLRRREKDDRKNDSDQLQSSERLSRHHRK